MKATTLCQCLVLAFSMAALSASAGKAPPPEKKVAQAAKKPTAKKPAAKKPAAKKGAVARKETVPKEPGPLADFGETQAPDDVVHVANWVSYTHNNFKRNFVLIDKKQARLYVFQPDGKLKGHSPILLGKAIGDHTVPGVGDKPLSQVKEEEKTTPAGRFFAQPGKNTKGENIIWIDYKAAVSMHRMRMVAEEERRAERMATPEPDDNRISYGCVNVPAPFYDKVLRPSLGKRGMFVYVLPETRTPQQLFGSFDVPKKA
ncbi:MAG: L,D-transpeptidase [Burkholderiales bacterium]|nr:L,D-transpeptidase [Burkholderiales bacterium]